MRCMATASVMCMKAMEIRTSPPMGSGTGEATAKGIEARKREGVLRVSRIKWLVINLMLRYCACQTVFCA